MIQVENLVKWYGPTLAVDHISFTIPKGVVVGFLGPNGAGKTTTLRIITGYIPPTAGRAMVGGFDSYKQSDGARARIGYLPENNPLYPEMRVDEYLQFRGKLYGMDRARRKSRIEVVVSRCGLAPVRRRLIGQLSKGNRQRVGLAQAMLHEPPVLILDEPTSGLDPNQVTELRKLIDELRGEHTIVLSTHILPEVEKTADRVLIIAGGRIAAEGTIEELKQKLPGEARMIVEVKASAAAVSAALGQAEGVAAVETTMANGWCRAVVTPRPQAGVREGVAKVISLNQWLVREMRYDNASLEQFFVRITAEQASRPGAA